MFISDELEAELNATPVETAVDKVLDGIDAAKVRGRLIETLDNVINNPDFGVYNYDHDLNAIADELLKQFIITPRS